MPRAGIEPPTFGTKGLNLTTKPLGHLGEAWVKPKVYLELNCNLSYTHLLLTLDLINILQ